jgi:tetratricopeptide (TPR) repeat protein
MPLNDSNYESDTEFLFRKWCDRISCLLEDGELDAADDEIDDILRAYPQRWQPPYLKATCLALQGRVEKSIPLFARSILIEPSAEAYFNLANAHRFLYHIEEWVACLQKAVELDGHSGEIGKRANEDVEEFASSVRKSDGLALDRYFEMGKTFERAVTHLSAGRYEDAVRGFSEVVRVLPRHVPSYGNLGLAYAGLGDNQRALVCLETAISIDPSYRPAIYNKAILLDLPFDERLLVGSARNVDFYEDRARAHSSQRPAALRLACR